MRKLDGLSSGKLLWHFCFHTQVTLVARKHLNSHFHMYFIERKNACVAPTSVIHPRVPTGRELKERVSCLWIPGQFSFSSGSSTACTHMLRNRGHQRIDGGRQKSATKSKGPAAIQILPVCCFKSCCGMRMTIKSRCKCRRSSKKPDGCKCGYHVNQKDNAFPSTSVCDKKKEANFPLKMVPAALIGTGVSG